MRAAVEYFRQLLYVSVIMKVVRVKNSGKIVRFRLLSFRLAINRISGHLPGVISLNSST